MKLSTVIRRLILATLLTLLSTGAPLAAEAARQSQEANAKPGYSVDGRTSASVLAAKRSHQVAKEDEVGLAVFSGLFAIAVIVFFSKQYFDSK